MFCATGLVFGGTNGVGSRFHDWYARTRFRRYWGRRVPFSCLARPNSFSAVSRASGSVFMFCAPGHVFSSTVGAGPIFMFILPGLVFGGIESVGSRFNVLCSRTHFRLYRGRPFPFSSFPLPDMFSAVPRASGPFFMFCAPGLIFGGTVGVGWHFRVLRARTRFWLYRGRQTPFSCFALPD
jgi:hypothetical protein